MRNLLGYSCQRTFDGVHFSWNKLQIMFVEASAHSIKNKEAGANINLKCRPVVAKAYAKKITWIQGRWQTNLSKCLNTHPLHGTVGMSETMPFLYLIIKSCLRWPLVSFKNQIFVCPKCHLVNAHLMRDRFIWRANGQAIGDSNWRLKQWLRPRWSERVNT